MLGRNKRRGVLKHAPVHVGPNMTPMVDVVMCILIFFMLGSSLVVPDFFLKSNTAAVSKAGLGSESATAKLPSVMMKILLTRGTENGGATMVAAFDTTPVALTAPAAGARVEDNPVFQRLASRTISEDVQVLIVPSSDVPWQDVITIYDFCTKLEFKQVAFYPVQ